MMSFDAAGSNSNLPPTAATGSPRAVTYGHQARDGNYREVAWPFRCSPAYGERLVFYGNGAEWWEA